MILVDSDVLISHLRGLDTAREWLVAARRGGGPLAVSVVSLAGISGGMRPSERRDVTRLVDALQAVPVNRAVAWRAGELRRVHHRSRGAIGLADYLIAATALVHGCELATLNVKHFPMFEGLTPPFTLT